MRLMWINERARDGGGCERSIAACVDRLRDGGGVESTLVYDLDGGVELSYLRHFDASFPRVSLAEQIQGIDPDLIYVHRLSDPEALQTVVQSGYPVLRFLHDHQLLCLREHKYTVIGRQTCTQPLGLGCYACLGCVQRSEGFPGVRFRGLGEAFSLLDLHRQMDGLVVASTYLRDHLVEHGFSPQRIHVLPLFADMPADRVPRQGAGDYLLFVGALVTGKGLDLLLEAVRGVPEATRLVVVGEGRQGEELRQQARSLGLEGRVEFLGSRSPDQLDELFRGARAVIVPSRSPETFGLVGIEAMSHGVPVIASRVGAMPEWLAHRETGLLFESGDVIGLARAIQEVLRSQEQAERMGQAGYRAVRQRYLPEHHVEGLSRLVRSFSESRRARS